METAFKTNGVLDFVGCVRVHDVSTTFVAVDNFVENTSDNTKVKIGEESSLFGARFLARGGKVESVVAQTVLYCYKLLMGKFCPTTSDILAAIGDEAHAETALADIYALLVKQPNGEDGILLSKPHAFNLFFVRDIVGVLKVIIVCWWCEGWRITVGSVDGPNGYGRGHQVFLRHFVFEEPAPTS